MKRVFLFALLYAKATTEGANRTIVVRGYAIRID